MAWDLRPVGIWSPSALWAGDGPGQPEARRAAAVALDDLGFGALWLGNAPGDLRLVEELLAATKRLVVASGIVNIWTNPAEEVAASLHRVSTIYPGRVLLGIGVSHAPSVQAAGLAYRQPLRRMTGYLDELDAAPDPVPADVRVLAALGPRSLALAARRAGGAHPYLTIPEHTALARREMGPQALLAPEQKVVFAPDRTTVREVARGHLAFYLTLPNYVRNFRRMGFSEEDVSGAGSDRLIDALYAWGVDAVRERVREHREAGADHVPVQVVTPPDPAAHGRRLAVDEWRELAAGLL